MKAVCANTPSGGSVANGRVHRPRRDVENEEIQMYLSKLKELVPFMPRNRKLSKLEVIQYVIDYICDLQYALETHPAVATTGAPTVAAAAAAAAASPRRRRSAPGSPWASWRLTPSCPTPPARRRKPSPRHLRTWRKFRHPTAGPCRAEGGSPRGRWPSICHHHRHRHHHPSSRAFENCTTIDHIAPIHPSINVSELLLLRACARV